MIRLGLTGGIGMGKSTAAELLAKRGAKVCDSDALARELVAPGQPALAEIVEAFGGGSVAGGWIRWIGPRLGSWFSTTRRPVKNWRAFCIPAFVKCGRRGSRTGRWRASGWRWRSFRCCSRRRPNPALTRLRAWPVRRSCSASASVLAGGVTGRATAELRRRWRWMKKSSEPIT